MSNSNFMEYLFETHKNQLTKGADYIALLCHSILLDKKCKLKNGKAVLSDDWNKTDPIRLVYSTPNNVDINMSIVETSGDVFVNATESVSDRLGSMEVIIDDTLCMRPNISLLEAYPQMNELSRIFEENVWQKLFPLPKPDLKNTTNKSHQSSEPLRRMPYYTPNSLIDPTFNDIGPGGNILGGRYPLDYGRADMDPFGLGSHPLGIGPGMHGGPGRPLGGGGGMLFDPRGGNRNESGPLFPGASPLAGPPGARIDPIYPHGPQFPGGGGGGRGRGASRPDPDMPHPPGWEDMYL